MTNHRQGKIFPTHEAKMLEMEREYLQKHPVASIDSYCRDEDFEQDVREMLINENSLPIEPASGRILDLQRVQIALDALDTEAMTSLLLQHSLCPIHRVDYAICFDDDDPECAQVRAIHPGHDT